MNLRRNRPSRLAAIATAGVLAVVACGSVAAGEGRPGRGGARAAMRAGPFAGRGMRAERMQPPARGPQEREGASPAAAPPPPVERPAEQPVDRGGRPGRLTPDERRALRQQINDAGRDIYRAPRP